MPSQSTMPLYGKSAMPLYGITNILSSHTNKEEVEEVPLSLGYYYYIKPEMESYHIHALLPNQCGSILVQTIDAPLPLVWSILRQFDNPQAYKQFITSCTMRTGSGGIGSIREVMVSSGLPAKTSMERLDKLDDDKHVMDFSIVGGEHRLANYSCTTTVQEKKGRKTVVIQSYVVDVPAGSSKEDTCLFANTIIGCNLRSLAKVTERMAD